MKPASPLVVAAVSQELQPFLAQGTNGAVPLLTGIGFDRARMALRRYLSRFPVEWIVSTGFSGGTRAGFRVGDLVAASEAIDLASGRRWSASLGSEKISKGVTLGPFVTARRLVRDPQAKERVGSQYQAVAVDMETAAVAQTAQEFGIPWAGFRVILDPMETWAWSPRRLGALWRFLGEVRQASGSLSIGLQEFCTGGKYGS